MKRPILKLLICLTLGLATTVLIAWYAALFVPICGGPFPLGAFAVTWPSQTQSSPIRSHQVWSSRTLSARRDEGVIFSSVADGNYGSSFSWHVSAGEQYDAGWPWPALRWTAEALEKHKTVNGLAATVAPFTRNATESGFPAPASFPFLGLQPNRRIPTTPLWWGLAANSFLFGAAWLTLLSAPRVARTRLRLHRGLCSACAYNLAGIPRDAPCPECGTGRSPPAPQRWRRLLPGRLAGRATLTRVGVVLVSIVLLLVVGLVVIRFTLWQLDHAYYSVRDGAVISRAQVESRLPGFFSADVGIADIPAGYRPSAPLAPGQHIVRYGRFGIAAHVIYDSNDRLVMFIPSYE